MDDPQRSKVSISTERERGAASDPMDEKSPEYVARGTAWHLQGYP